MAQNAEADVFHTEIWIKCHTKRGLYDSKTKAITKRIFASQKIEHSYEFLSPEKKICLLKLPCSFPTAFIHIF